MRDTAYQCIALDMDGTVLNDEKQIGARTCEAIHRALAEGKEVVFCTGRSHAEMRETLKEFPEMHWLLGESGGLVYDLQKRKPMYVADIPRNVTEALQEVCRGRDMMPNIFSGGEYYMNLEHADKLAKYQMGQYQETIPPVCKLVEDVFETILFGRRNVEKINLYHTSIEEREITRNKVQKMDLAAEFVDSETSSLECSPLGVSKGSGLRHLAQLMGITTEQIIMVGDANNDIEGLKEAGLAVAMGNANDQVIAVSDVQVADNNHDGVAEAIDRFLLGIAGKGSVTEQNETEQNETDQNEIEQEKTEQEDTEEAR